MKHTLRTVTLLRLALLAGCFLLGLPAARAQINYQGRLTDAVGAPLPDGQYPIQFSLWTAATGGAAPVWGPYILDGGGGPGHGPLADLVGSRFNVIIGNLDTTSRSLTTSMAGSLTVYLEIKVGSDAPISPRQIILAAPRALVADTIPNVTPNGAGVQISGTATFTGPATFAGNVGVGTTSPADKFHLVGPSNARLRIESTDNTYAGFLSANNQAAWFTGINPASGAGVWEVFQNFPAGGSRLAIDTSGKVGIGTTTPTAKLEVNGAIKATTVNGEKPPYVIQIGTVNDQSLWHAVQVPDAIIRSYLGDADGGTVRILLRRNSDDLTHGISEKIYIEQPDVVPGKPDGNTPGLSGSTLQQGGGGETYFTLGNGTAYDWIPTPYGWIWMRNYPTRGLPGLPGGSSGPAWTGSDRFHVEFLTLPNVSATIIIYDRP